MIGFMPEIYPDELLYSQLARYYYRSGYMAYIFAAEDLYMNKRVRPDIEFVNALTKDAYSAVTRNMPIYEIVERHTMFSYYGRFLSKERRNRAFSALVNMDGNYHNHLLIPNTKKVRYLRYCPVCSAEDKKKYCEAYWHRVHQMYDVDICPVHFCKLKETDVAINQKTSPKLITANEILDFNDEGIYECESDIEKKLSQYIMAVFKAKIDLDSDVRIGEYISLRLQNTSYMAGKMRNMKMLTSEYNKYYGTKTELWRLQKILTNANTKVREVCMLAMFLGITADEICNPVLPDNTIKLNKRKINRKGKYGPKIKDWNRIDKETLPKVRNVIQDMRGAERPRKITFYAVEQMLKLPSRQIRNLPKCKEEILKYYETQPQFWAREVEWAVNKICSEGKTLNLKRICALTNMRKKNIISAMPYLKDEARYIVVKIL